MVSQLAREPRVYWISPPVAVYVEVRTRIARLKGPLGHRHDLVPDALSLARLGSLGASPLDELLHLNPDRPVAGLYEKVRALMVRRPSLRKARHRPDTHGQNRTLDILRSHCVQMLLAACRVDSATTAATLYRYAGRPHALSART